MAEPISIQQLKDASLDVKSLEEVVNGDENVVVTTRLGETYPSVKGSIKTLFENGGLPAIPYKTVSEMLGTGASEGQYAIVTDDPDVTKLGLYVAQDGVWVKSKYNPLQKDQVQGTFFGATSALNINTTNSLLELSIGSRIVWGSNSEALTAHTVPLPSTDNFYKLLYSTTAKKVVIKLSGATLVSDEVLFGYIRRLSGKFAVYGIPFYKVNGREIADFGYELGFVTQFASSAFDINTVTNELKIISAARIHTNKGNYVTPSTTVSLPTTPEIYRVEYDVTNDSIHVEKADATKLPTRILFAKYKLDFLGNHSLLGLDGYTVNGKSVNTSSSKRAYLLPQLRSDINFDFVNGKFEILKPVRLIVDGVSTLVQPLELTIPVASSKGWYCLLYNTETNVFSATRITSNTDTNLYIVGYFDNYQIDVELIPYYSINGQEVGAYTDFIEDGVVIPYGNVYEDYVPDGELEPLKPIFDATTTKLFDFYALYDALVAANPEYITMEILGTDSVGNQIRQYRFNAPDVPINPVDKAINLNKPKMILCANVHGERAGTYNLYNCMRIICEDWQNHKSLEALRWGTDIVVVPIVTPYNFIHGDRHNPNGVDIARNFAEGWRPYAVGSYTYSGTAPFSELESQILDSVMSNHRDAIMFASHHAFSSKTQPWLPNGVFAWIPHATEFGASMGRSLMTSATIEAKKRYDWIAKGSADYVGYVDRQLPGGSEGYHSTMRYGMCGATFETTELFNLEPSQPQFSAAVTTMGAYLFINWMLLHLRYAPQIPKPSIKDSKQ